MEGDLGTQIAPPLFIHQSLSGRFCDALPMTKKRDLPWQNLNFLQQQQQLQHQQTLHLNPGFQNPKSNWNPKGWEWDSNTFRAKPSAETEQEKKMEESLNPTKKKTTVDENGENLTLKLGGAAYSVDEPVVRPNKRVRSGSPGGATYPMCQVDDCKGDLSNAKDYHRRHKVCEFHSKKTQALVGKQMQRFCQQCSRFHPLSEFDEGKRSCRRRLAGHNRRRRKTQPDHVSTRMLLPEILENNGGGNLNIINLLAILARLQGTNGDKPANGQSILDDKDRLVQFLSKINSLPASADSNTKSSAPRSFDLNISHNLQASSELPSELSRNSFAPTTTDLVTVLSAALAASSPDALAILSQGNCDGYVDDKGKRNCLEKDGGFNLPKKMNPVLPSVGEDRHNGFFGSPEDASMLPTQEAHLNLPLQLFSSSPEDDSPPNLASSRKYFSSDSSNPLEERSPSSSPPVVQKLFPLHSAKPERIPIRREDNAAFEGNTYMGRGSSLELFKGSNARADNSAVSNPPYQAGYASSSGSDHSPSSSNSDSQDRTGRIIFKLFDKDPSDLPGTLRMQILNWLSNSPSEMESYIRPGCVVLSIYVSMPSIAWDELQDNLSQRVSSLVKESGLEFWATSRFLVQTERQLASYKDSKIRLCKSLRTWSAPQIVSVMPLAVVGGEETSLVVMGRNLAVPGTKFHCTYMGGYISKEISSSTYSGTIYDDSSLETFHFSSEVPSGLGRCFVEVENGFKGNCFPIIIADASICRELRILESEFEDNARLEDTLSEDQNQYFRQPGSRVDVLHFLNELGWLFQRKCTSKRITPADFSLVRLKSLFIFSVERDWPALVKALLDILVEGTSIRACLSEESLETLSEVHLLNRAVKRRCRKMVDLLLHYSVSDSCDTSKNYLFPPNLTGPGGVTPLHLAACTQDSQEMIDALTNDPQEIGLNCWGSLLDASGNSPYMYASMRNHHSYNRLVARKIADRRNGQLSIAVSDSEIYLDRSRATAKPNKSTQPLQIARSCAQCAVLTSRRPRRIPGTQGLLHRPYVHSLLAIAAVCVCVCLLFRGLPQIGSVAPFEWENVLFGPC